MKFHEVQRRFTLALEAFLAIDHDLLRLGVTERAVAGCLQTHLVPRFPDHHVDVEYNRHGFDTKTIEHIPGCTEYYDEPARIFPDIIVHRRGNDTDNLLAVEIKRTGASKRLVECDRLKLASLRAQYGYRYTLLLEIPSVPDEAHFGFEWSFG